MGIGPCIEQLLFLLLLLRLFGREQRESLGIQTWPTFDQCSNPNQTTGFPLALLTAMQSPMSSPAGLL